MQHVSLEYCSQLYLPTADVILIFRFPGGRVYIWQYAATIATVFNSHSFLFFSGPLSSYQVNKVPQLLTRLPHVQKAKEFKNSNSKLAFHLVPER